MGALFGDGGAKKAAAAQERQQLSSYQTQVNQFNQQQASLAEQQRAYASQSASQQQQTATQAALDKANAFEASRKFGGGFFGANPYSTGSYLDASSSRGQFLGA